MRRREKKGRGSGTREDREDGKRKIEVRDKRRLRRREKKDRGSGTREDRKDEKRKVEG
ncbi:hypothetical protein [Paenibacillus sp. SAFN-117]|uniref:hypothetical protein n=1 Tax=Paenibacillus sp. SAFN-117 TaxID=3436860 RepID=UPI003F7E9DC2